MTERAVRRPVLHRAPLRPRVHAAPQQVDDARRDGSALAPRRRAGRAHERSSMVLAEAVHKRFGRLEVLKGIDLEVARGEVMCLLGPSGSGKSTFLRCINHLEKINAGRLYGRRRAGRLPRGRRQAARAARARRRPQARRDRDGVPALQPVPAHDGARERHRWRRCGCRASAASEARERARGAAATGSAWPTRSTPIPVAALRRPAAAGGDRPRAGHAAEADAVRRADLGARPRARRRRARRDARPGRATA